jgi:REP element-mobilizing transposase RayT
MPRKPRKRHVQQDLVFTPKPRRGGRRKGAGRKPREPRPPGRGPGVPHLPRPALAWKHPVHVTLRVRRDVPNLRRNAFLPVLTDALRAGCNRFGFGLCHYVVMGNHLHLIVEADDERCLARGLQGLAIRLAKRVNRAAGRRGRFFADRYHAHVLKTPTEVHRALSYVLLNLRKHEAELHPSAAAHASRGLDPFSSGAWFDGWHEPSRAIAHLRRGDPPVVLTPRSWLLRGGWKRVGTIASH